MDGDALGDAGVVNQDVDFAVLVFDVLDERVDALFVGDVEHEAVSLVTRRLNLGDSVLATLLVHVGDDDLRARLSEHVGNAATDTALGAAARDDDDLVFEIKHSYYLQKIFIRSFSPPRQSRRR